MNCSPLRYLDLLPREPSPTPEDWEAALDQFTVQPPAQRVPLLPLRLGDVDFAAAVRSLGTGPDRIYYFKYVTAPEDVTLDIRFKDQPLKLQWLGRQRAGPLSVRIVPGQTTMVDCRGRYPYLDFECERTTADP